MWPRAILFDLDDTLFDHQRASTIALGSMHAAHAPDLPFEAFANRHAEVLELFHTRFLAGEFTLDEARVSRMQTLFAAFDREIDAATATRAAMLYRQQHQANRSLVPGAIELLAALRGHCRLGIVTNNSTVEQIEKLRALDIARYFDTVVISEDVGVTKPDPQIFAIALERIGAHAHEAVFIGDNWINDIVGAQNVGMAAVWLDRSQTQALAHLSEHKPLESLAQPHSRPFFPAARGVGDEVAYVATITSLAPTAAVIAAIKSVSTNRTSGAEQHEQLETLAS